MGEKNPKDNKTKIPTSVHLLPVLLPLPPVPRHPIPTTWWQKSLKCQKKYYIWNVDHVASKISINIDFDVDDLDYDEDDLDYDEDDDDRAIWG